MKKIILVALLALPFLAAPPKAAAQCCGSCAGGGHGTLACIGNKICTYANALHPCGCGHGVPWQGGVFSCFGCPGRIPGPWYLYWPNNNGYMTSSYSYGTGASWWSLENHFVAPAPTGYFAYPQSMGMSASWAAPGGSAPSYWYGR